MCFERGSLKLSSPSCMKNRFFTSCFLSLSPSFLLKSKIIQLSATKFLLLQAVSNSLFETKNRIVGKSLVIKVKNYKQVNIFMHHFVCFLNFRNIEYAV